MTPEEQIRALILELDDLDKRNGEFQGALLSLVMSGQLSVDQTGFIAWNTARNKAIDVLETYGSFPIETLRKARRLK